MKPVKVLMFMLLTVCSFTGFCQDVLTEPDYADVFFRLDAGKLIPLERETATVQGKAGGFIVMSMKASSEFPGANSPARFHAGQPLDFIVKSPLAPTAVDPNSLFVLRKLNGKKKTRELVIMTGHALPVGASTKTGLAEGVLPVTFVRYGSSSIKMSVNSLPPGEYAISRPFAQTVFCFGID